MTDVAREIAIENRHRRTNGKQHREHLLPLIGGVPVTVLVRVDQHGKAWFSTRDQPSWFSGISWMCGGYSLMITFQFVNDLGAQRIEELRPETPSFWFTDTFRSDSDGPVDQQACCVPPVPGTYHFLVELGDGLVTDPKIVVTPITA